MSETPFRCSKTPSIPQKHPPAKTAVCPATAEVETTTGSGAVESVLRDAPLARIHDAKALSKKELACGREAAVDIFDNPLESLAITEISVAYKRPAIVYGQQREVLYTTAHTLFGIKYETVASLCNVRTGLECAGRVDDVWSNRSHLMKQTQPCG